MKNYNKVLAECKAFLKEHNFHFKNGQWRIYIEGAPLTNTEIMTNRYGGRPFGANAVMAVANLATSTMYEESDGASDLLKSHNIDPDYIYNMFS